MSSHSVTPSQSVSNVECSVTRGGLSMGIDSVEPVGVPESPFPYLHLIDANGRGEVVAAYWKAYLCYAEAVKTTCALRAGTSSASFTSASSGTSSRFPRRRRSRRRRTPSSSVASSPCSSDIDAASLSASRPGRCYLGMFLPRYRLGVSEIGDDPTFREVFSYPSEWYVPFEQAQNLRVSRTSPGMYHLGVKHGPTLPECAMVLLDGSGVDSPWSGAKIPAADDLRGRVQLCDRLGSGVYRPDLTYGRWLACVAGHEGEDFPSDKVSLLSRSAAVRSPYEKVTGKMLEALGDSVLSTSVALRCVERGMSAEQYQTARSEVTTNPSLSRVFLEKVPAWFVLFPSGVSPGTGKAGAYMLEAIIGAIYQVYGQDAVTHACEVLGIFDLHRW